MVVSIRAAKIGKQKQYVIKKEQKLDIFLPAFALRYNLNRTSFRTHLKT
jgi:hypothetical protein